MSRSKFHRQTPRVESDGVQTEVTDGEVTSVESDGTGPIEAHVVDIVESRTTDLREDLEALEAQVEAVDNFARISLNERKVKQNEVKLSEFSDSMTAFAETAFNNINALEDRLDRQALVLAAIVESFDDDELDLSAVHRYEEERLVSDASPDERLAAALGHADDD